MRKPEKRAPVFISACLAGLACRYDGQDKRNPDFLQQLNGQRVIFECPESLGGLPVPRIPADIETGDGHDVLAGRARVVNRDGRDVTPAFVKGAGKVLSLMRAAGASVAFLKSKSPSCGIHTIKRNGKTIRGCGVTAALLTANNISVQEV